MHNDLVWRLHKSKCMRWVVQGLLYYGETTLWYRNKSILILLWLFSGLTELQCDNISKLQNKLEHLRSLLNDPVMFKAIYRYSYDFARVSVAFVLILVLKLNTSLICPAIVVSVRAKFPESKYRKVHTSAAECWYMTMYVY